MKCVLLGGLVWCGLLIAGNQQSEINVNSRYIVESVEVSGRDEAAFSAGLRQDIQKLIGENLDSEALDQLGKRIRKELHVRSVTHRVLRGLTPEHVRVVFEIKGPPAKFEVSVPKFLYYPKQGWSAAVEGTSTIAHNSFTLGLVSDNDETSERYTGATARYENNKVGTDRLQFRFDFGSYHEQWNRTTLMALADSTDVPGIYRTRQEFQPIATVVLMKPLTVSFGAAIDRFQTQYPVAEMQAANAAVAGIRYSCQTEDSDFRQDFDAAYTVRAATHLLNSDFAYVRHRADVRYVLTAGNHRVLDEFIAGLISGRAPLFERFVLGTSSTLRGWNRFDLDPLGGDRMVHNSLEYRYRVFQVFYDTGAIWDRNRDPVARHSVGVGVRHDGFSLAVAFPVKEGRADPIFMVSMNY